MKRKDVIRAIQKGTLTANEEYLEWTGGWSIGDSGVEGHLVSVIARQLREYQDDDESLLMECPFVCIREWSEASRPRGRPRRVVKDTNRADIVLFNTKEKPICVIEVKRRWTTGPCLQDLERVNELVKRCSHLRNGTLRRGFLAVYLEHEQSVDGEQRRIENLVSEKFDDEKTSFRFHVAKRHDDGNTWEFACLCIEIHARQ